MRGRDYLRCKKTLEVLQVREICSNSGSLSFLTVTLSKIYLTSFNLFSSYLLRKKEEEEVKKVKKKEQNDKG